MNRLNKLEVFYHERLVGTIALYQNRLAAFEASKWIFHKPFFAAFGKEGFYAKDRSVRGTFWCFCG